MIILVATDQEFELAKKYLGEYKIVQTGVGASNVIKKCSELLISFVRKKHYEPIINIGFSGSNTLPKGTVTKVRRSYRFIDHTVGFKDYRNGCPLGNKGYDCYTSNDFVTEDERDEPVLYDMELNYIAAFPFNVLGSIKIVSDNLDVDEYAESIHTSTDQIWAQVRSLVDGIMQRP